MMTTTLDGRLENWGEVYRLRLRQGHLASIEGNFRGKWARAWDWTEELGWIPIIRQLRPTLDPFDAAVINLAWQTMPDVFHAIILGGHYVRQWKEPKTLRVAREAAGMATPRREFEKIDPYLTLAKLLIAGQLTVPAVTRRGRLAVKVRRALELESFDAGQGGDYRAVDTRHAAAL